MHGERIQLSEPCIASKKLSKLGYVLNYTKSHRSEDINGSQIIIDTTLKVIIKCRMYGYFSLTVKASTEAVGVWI